MRTLIISVLAVVFILTAAECKAQNADEWLRQKETQKKYLLQQISALNAYANYAKKGYAIAKEGLNTIGSAALDEFKAHSNYFNSLKTVSPAIKNQQHMYDVADLHDKILIEVASNLRGVRQNKYFTSSEKDYIWRVFSRLRQDSDQTMDELNVVLTDRSLEMSDSERLERINDIYNEMQRMYAFGKQFSNQVKSIFLDRQQSEKEIEKTRRLYGIQK